MCCPNCVHAASTISDTHVASWVQPGFLSLRVHGNLGVASVVHDTDQYCIVFLSYRAIHSCFAILLRLRFFQSCCIRSTSKNRTCCLFQRIIIMEICKAPTLRLKTLRQTNKQRQFRFKAICFKKLMDFYDVWQSEDIFRWEMYIVGTNRISGRHYALYTSFHVL